MTAWLFRVARNRIIDTYRKKNRKVSILPGIGSDEEDGDSYLAQIGAISAVRDDDPDALRTQPGMGDTYEVLSELPEEQRLVFELHELEKARASTRSVNLPAWVLTPY